jgi:hypothetical protein
MELGREFRLDSSLGTSDKYKPKKYEFHMERSEIFPRLRTKKYEPRGMGGEPRKAAGVDCCHAACHQFQSFQP